MKRISLLLIVLFSVVAQLTWAQPLAQWAFTNTSGTPGPSPLDPVTSDANLSIGGLTRGPGLVSTGATAANAWGASDFQDGVATASQTMDIAITNENYSTFTITANPGYKVSIDSIGAYNLRRSTTGPQAYGWQYSLDGINFTTIATNLPTGSGTGAAGNPKAGINLSGIPALQDVFSGTTITIRIIAWGTSSEGGVFYINGGGTNPNLNIFGSVVAVPLPLELLAFKGKREHTVNHLEWTTAHEENVSHFELERGTDGRSFVKVAKINATGNNGITNNQYSHNDATAAATSYYRLRMVDMDGSARYSNIVALHDDVIVNSRHLYPNPTESTLFIEGIAGKSTYRIVDVAGREIVSRNTVTLTEGSAVTIDVAHLQQGIYFLQVSDDKGNETIRFVKK